VPLQSKPLAFLIENSSNKNSSQLADNKQKRPVLIENFEPTRARVFAPRHAPQIAPTSDAGHSSVAFLPGLPRAFFVKGSVRPRRFLPGSAQHVEIAVTHSKQSTDQFLPGSRIAQLAARPLWLLALLPHLTNCRLNRLQLFRRAGVCTKEHYSRSLSAPIRYSEASFVVE
jgi:hypothetical protein